MRIALVYDMIGGSGGGGGIARVILELSHGLRARGHRVTLVCHDFAPSTEFEQLTDDLDVRAVRPGVAEVPSGSRAILRRYWRGMRRLADCVPSDVDVVHAHNLPALRAGKLAAGRLGLPLVWTRYDDTIWERGLVPEMTSRGTVSPIKRAVRLSFGLFDLATVRSADEIIVPSDFDAAMLRRAYHRRAHVIRLGPADAFFTRSDARGLTRRALGLEDDDFLVLGFALLVPHRRFEDLIEAAAILRAVPRLHVLILGSDSYAPEYGARLAELIRVRGLEQRITLDRRSVTDAELRDIYAAADLYVFPSSRQSYGLAPLEAIAAGKPVVVSSGAGVHELLEGKPGVTVVPPSRPDEIAAAISDARAASDKTGLETTRSWIRSEVSAEASMRSTEAVLERALRAGRTPGFSSQMEFPNPGS